MCQFGGGTRLRECRILETKVARKTRKEPRLVGGILFYSLAALKRHIKAMLDRVQSLPSLE